MSPAGLACVGWLFPFGQKSSGAKSFGMFLPGCNDRRQFSVFMALYSHRVPFTPCAIAVPFPMLQHHQPHQVCLESLTDQSTRIHLRHTNVTLSVLLAATVDEIARFVPPNLLHVHQINLELRPVPVSRTFRLDLPCASSFLVSPGFYWGWLVCGGGGARPREKGGGGGNILFIDCGSHPCVPKKMFIPHIKTVRTSDI